MCTELFLALIYFLIIFLVNFFLIKLVIKSIKTIAYLIKIQSICNCFKEKKGNNIWLFLNLLNKNFNMFPNLVYLNKFKTTQDILIIGKMYGYLTVLLKENKSIIQKNTFYYLLLSNQYLNQIEKER